MSALGFICFYCLCCGDLFFRFMAGTVAFFGGTEGQRRSSVGARETSSSASWPSNAVQQHCCSQPVRAASESASASAKERIKRINKRIQIKFLINELPLNLYINYNFYSWRLCFVYDQSVWLHAKRPRGWGAGSRGCRLYGSGTLTRRPSSFRLHCIAYGPAILIVFRIGKGIINKELMIPPNSCIF